MDTGGQVLANEQQHPVANCTTESQTHNLEEVIQFAPPWVTVAPTEGDLESKDDRRDRAASSGMCTAEGTPHDNLVRVLSRHPLSCAAIVSFDNSVNLAPGLSEFRFDCWQQYWKID
jgi:hypothetical protein